MVRYSLASELNAGIVSFSYKLGFEVQFEVGVFFLAYEEFVVGDFFVKEASHDGTVFNPKKISISFPPD
jgi:hypothetical protein